MDLSKSYDVFQPEKLKGRINIIGCGSVGSTIVELLARYGERMVSRMIGGYCRVVFTGRDVRQIITMEREKNGGISG